MIIFKYIWTAIKMIACFIAGFFVVLFLSLWELVEWIRSK